jgi:hypothetical protein
MEACNGTLPLQWTVEEEIIQTLVKDDKAGHVHCNVVLQCGREAWPLL